jgi:hypothetical protein
VKFSVHCSSDLCDSPQSSTSGNANISLTVRLHSIGWFRAWRDLCDQIGANAVKVGKLTRE